MKFHKPFKLYESSCHHLLLNSYDRFKDEVNVGDAQVFALHPLYLSLNALAPKDMPEELAERISEARAQLDQREVEYEQTVATKLAIARELFDRRGRAELQVELLQLLSCMQSATSTLSDTPAIYLVLTGFHGVLQCRVQDLKGTLKPMRDGCDHMRCSNSCKSCLAQQSTGTGAASAGLHNGWVYHVNYSVGNLLSYLPTARSIHCINDDML